jgi:hypothetical protein
MKALALMLAVIMLAATGWHYYGNRITADLLVEDDPAINFDDPESLDPQQLEAEQLAAAEAALALAGEPPLAGKITERPKFVSRVEWQILKAVAASHENSEDELLRLVNYLGFSKQLEWWQSQQPDLNHHQYVRVGWKLLNEIPERVEQNDLAVDQAQQLQVALLEELEPDTGRRRHHLEREAARIGVTFRIESSSYSQDQN